MDSEVPEGLVSTCTFDTSHLCLAFAMMTELPVVVWTLYIIMGAKIRMRSVGLTQPRREDCT